MLKITKCPTCGSDKIEKVCRDLTETFDSQTYTVPALEFYECPNCGEQLYDREAMRKIEAHLPSYAKKKMKKAA
ncbi:MAG: type II toxin-antitoxin system MqsA family antitoxin [Acidobacteriota bacterium]|nr:type II toxin-antitoxin system MqsA family antitoxin [Acidobacteriota bacterium]